MIISTQHAARIVISVMLLSLVACGGGGGGDDLSAPSNLPPPPPPPPAVQMGVFKDRNVAGLTFASGAQTGVTDSAGHFTCETGNSVVFSIGGVDLGQTACASLVTPNQLATDDAMFELEVANLARFLQMLDEDSNAANGIVISAAVQQIAVNWAQVDFRAVDLANELVTIISDAASVDPSPATVHALPAEPDALAHLQHTLDCAFAGAFAGSFSGGGNSGAATIQIGGAIFGAGFSPFSFEWNAADTVAQFFAGGGAGNGQGFTIRNLPELDFTGLNVSGPLAARFLTPDEISGTWTSGTIQFQRIGGDDGSPYRFVGTANNGDGDIVISLNFDGSNFSGQAFDINDGSLLDVTGTLSGTAVSLTASSGGTTAFATGTLTSQPDGSPDSITGTTNDGGSFNLGACRLN